MKKILIVLLLCAAYFTGTCQEVYNSSGKSSGFKKKTKREKGYDPSKLVIGGGLNLAYGGGYAVAGLSPIVGYHFFNNFVGGVGVGYLYQQQPNIQYTTAYKTYYDREHIIYPNLWARYVVWRGLYLSTCFEHDIIKLSVPDRDAAGSLITSHLNVGSNALLAGIGLKQPIGGRVSFFVEVVHDFLQQTYSPYYGQPILFRAGVCAGL